MPINSILLDTTQKRHKATASQKAQQFTLRDIEITTIETSSRILSTLTRVHLSRANRLPSQRILSRIASRLVGTLFPRQLKSYKPSIGKCIHQVLRSTLNDLDNRITARLRFRHRSKRIIRAGYSRVIKQFTSNLPQLHSLLISSVHVTCTNSPTTHDITRILIYCPNIRTVVRRHLTRDLRILKIPFVTHIVSRLNHSRAKVSVRPTTRVKKNFFVSRKAKIIVKRATVVNSGIHLCRRMALKTGGLSNIRGKVPERPVIRSSIIVCSNTAILKHVAVNGNTIVNNNY